MSNDVDSRNWFTFFMALTIVCLGCIGALIAILNNQLWSKLDRMVALMQERSRDIGVCLDRVNEKLSIQQVEIQELKTRYEIERNLKNGRKK